MEDRKDIRFNIPIMSDFNYKISEKFMVYDELNGCCADSTFIINNHGIIKTKTVGEYSLQLNEIIRLIQAFQFSDKYNVVCQSKWVKGKKGVSLYLILKINPTHKDPRLPIYWKEELVGIKNENIQENDKKSEISIENKNVNNINNIDGINENVNSNNRSFENDINIKKDEILV